MGFRPHPRAQTSAENPRSWATCDRCGLVYNLDRLVWQFDWRGTELQNTQVLVCKQTCLDKPQRQLGTVILPPDPVGVLNARPEPYPSDEYWMFLFEGAGYPVYLEGSQSAITLELSIYSNDGDWPWPP